VCSTDIAQFTILPPLVKRLASVAPSVRIDLRSITEEAPRLLESGEADLAIGLIPQMGAGFCQQKLFASRFVCAVRTDHPRIKDKLTLEQFQSESHVSVTMLGTGYHSLERTLESQKIRRNIAMRVPSFLGVAGIISDTDYLVIVPQRLGRMLCEDRRMRLLPLPFPLPGYYVTQNWHERYTHDPAQQWFRNVLVRLFREEAQASAGPVIVPAKARRS
jgi:DNA-binding transcriptional LysR family regulator